MVERLDENERSDPSRRLLVTGASGFIGSALVRALARRGDCTVLNYDVAEPAESAARWIVGDIRDLERMRATFRDFDPTDVVHLAARTDIRGTELADYATNTRGTSNVIECVVNGSVTRLILASTQFVCRPGHEPQSDEDYHPHTVYGESKVEAERLVRVADLDTTWTIVRPTTIWGPGDLAYRSQFYRIMARGMYFHPSGEPAMRSYGYVGNVVDQMLAILDSATDRIAGQTLYVGDPVAPITDFVEEFARQIGRSVRTVPRELVRVLAVFGDVMGAVSVPFPITTGRFRSMVEHYPVPIARTFDLLGPPRYELGEAVAETISWLRAIGLIARDAGSQ